VFRLFIALNLLILNLFACQGGYDSCIQKVKDAGVISNNSLSIPVKNSKRLIYSLSKPEAKVLKHDPFLGLYLVKDMSEFAYDFDVNMHLQLGSAVVDTRRAIEGKILKNQVGLNTLATFSEKYKAPALLMSSCCSFEGIVTPKGIIQKEYIKRFLSNASAEYSDIGIRVKNHKRHVIVTASNPYMKDNFFKKGDILLELNGKKIDAASVFMREILFSKIGTKHRVKIKRDSKVMSLDAITQKRYGGGEISDTFLEYKGIYFDENMRIQKLSQEFKEYGLLVGDRLIQVNGTFVKTQAELRKYIEDFKDFSSLLFERENFQFFVNIK